MSADGDDHFLAATPIVSDRPWLLVFDAGDRPVSPLWVRSREARQTLRVTGKTLIKWAQTGGQRLSLRGQVTAIGIRYMLLPGLEGSIFF